MTFTSGSVGGLPQLVLVLVLLVQPEEALRPHPSRQHPPLHHQHLQHRSTHLLLVRTAGQACKHPSRKQYNSLRAGLTHLLLLPCPPHPHPHPHSHSHSHSYPHPHSHPGW